MKSTSTKTEYFKKEWVYEIVDYREVKEGWITKKM